MTRAFNVTYRCQHCHSDTTAETGFGRWMRNHPALDISEGIVRTDTDHVILRYKTYPGGRDFQLLMLLEVKERGAYPRADQKDIFSFVNQISVKKGKQVNGASTWHTWKLWSWKNERYVTVRYFGYHLLQFEGTNPKDSDWIKWNGKKIDEGTLVALLSMERVPSDPSKSMTEFLRDRHRKPKTLSLFPQEAA